MCSVMVTAMPSEEGGNHNSFPGLGPEMQGSKEQRLMLFNT